MDKKQYVLNALSNQGSFLISIILALLLSPLVVARLGDELYGIWTLVVAITGYYNFIDLGIRSAVGQYVTRYLAANDQERLERTLGTSLLVLGLVAGVVLGLTVAVAFTFPHFFKIDPSKWQDIRMAILLSGAAMALKFPSGVFQAMVIGCHRWDILSGRIVVARLAHGATVLYLLLTGWGILGVAIATFGAQVIEGTLLFQAARRLVPQARLSLSFDRASFREIRSYGVFAFIIAICEQVILYMDAFVIGYFLGPVAVTFYTIGANLIPYMDGLILSVSGQLRPLAIAFDAKNEEEALKTMLLKGSRYVQAFLCLIFVGVWVCGGDFLGTWMGEKYLAGTPFPSSGTVLLILAVAHLGFNASTVCRQILFGLRKNNILAAIAVMEALANLILKLVLVRRFGILGVAVGTLIPMNIFSGIVIPWVTARQVGVALRRYWVHAALPNLALMGLTGMAGLGFRAWIPFEGWPKVIATAAFVGSLHAVAVLFVIVDPEIRSTLFSKMRFTSGKTMAGAQREKSATGD